MDLTSARCGCEGIVKETGRVQTLPAFLLESRAAASQFINLTIPPKGNTIFLLIFAFLEVLSWPVNDTCWT